MNTAAVSLNHLSKTYADGKKAVNNILISLAPGEIFGFLGPNGAGKTTTVKLLNGILTPTEGSCSVYGTDPAVHPEKTHALSGVVTEHAQMYDHLTGMENLLFYGSLFGLQTAACTRRSLFLLEQMDLTGAKDKKLAAYSTGMRKRLSLARALNHQPKVLFLAEPTSGLDPQSAQNVHAIIQNLPKEQGITVFLCTHQLRYAQEICTRYGLIREGSLLAQGTLEELRKKSCSGMTVKIRAAGITTILPSMYPDQKSTMAAFQPEPGKPDHQPAEYLIHVQSEAEIPQLVRKILENGGETYHVSSGQPSLEELYFTLTDKQASSVQD